MEDQEETGDLEPQPDVSLNSEGDLHNAGDDEGQFETFRNYLHILAETQLHGPLKNKVDASDIVQQTMLQAYRAKAQFKGNSDGEKAAWLRAILGNVMCGLHRDYSREQSVQAVEQSSLQLSNLLTASSSSPSAAMHRDDWANELARVMLRLTSEQRQAIMLKYWHGATLAEISEQLGKSSEATAGLLFRGMRKLRNELGAE